MIIIKPTAVKWRPLKSKWNMVAPKKQELWRRTYFPRDSYHNIHGTWSTHPATTTYLFYILTVIFITNSFANFPAKQPQNEQHTRPPQSYISGHETCRIQAIGTIDLVEVSGTESSLFRRKPKCKQPNVYHDLQRIYFSLNQNFAGTRSLFDHPKCVIKYEILNCLHLFISFKIIPLKS